jgi:hypothetical protein
VLAYLTVFALSVGTVITFGLVTASTQQRVISTTSDSTYETTISRPDRTWWLLAPNPFAVLADSAPAGPVQQIRLPNGEVVEEPANVDVLGSMSRSLHRIRATPVEVQSGSGTFVEVPDGATGGPVWPLGLGIDLALGIAAVWVATIRLRTPTARLARGQRIA